MRNISKMAATVAVIPVLAFAGSAFAADSNSGQIEQGNIYRVRNITTDPSGSFVDPASATCGDTVQFRVRIHNPGPDPITDVKVGATLDGTNGVSHSSKVSITAGNVGGEVVTDTAGVNLNKAGTLDYDGGSTKLLDPHGSELGPLGDVVNPNGTSVNIGSVGVSIEQLRFVQFEATVHCPSTPQAAFSCDAFNIVADVNRTVKVSAFSTTATNGAAFNNAVLTWGDSSAPLTTDNVVGQTHQYAAEGTYTVTATAHFKVNGQGDFTASGPQCQKQVTFSSTTPPKVTPPATPPAAPTKLVNTGPGSVAGLFAATTAAGAVAYRWMLGRRLSRQ